MENEKILEMIKMRMDGAKLDDIAKQYGVSRELVRRFMPMQLSECRSRKRSYNGIVYPAIRNWMMANGMNKTRFAAEIGIKGGDLMRILSSQSNIKKSYIDRILAITGMTYEEAFGEKDEGDFEKC